MDQVKMRVWKIDQMNLLFEKAIDWYPDTLQLIDFWNVPFHWIDFRNAHFIWSFFFWGIELFLVD